MTLQSIDYYFIHFTLKKLNILRHLKLLKISKSLPNSSKPRIFHTVLGLPCPWELSNLSKPSQTDVYRQSATV